MNSDRDLDRRMFLKLGAAGTWAALGPTPQDVSLIDLPGQLTVAKGKLACPPALADMASDRLEYQFRKLFNAPTAMNEFGYAQVGKSVSSITAVSFPPYACCGPPQMEWSPGFLLTCELFLDSRFAAIAAPPDGTVE